MRYRHLRRTAIAVLAAVAFVLLLGVLAQRALTSSGVRRTAIDLAERLARERGLDLEIGSLHWGFVPPRIVARDITLTDTEFAIRCDRLEVELTGVSPPMALPHDAPFLRSLCQLLGQEPAEAVSYATDAGWLQSMGMECVLFGPGSIRVAHKPNEHLPREQFEQAGRVLEELVRSECAGPHGSG